MNKRQKAIYRSYLGIGVVVALVFLVVFWYWKVNQMIPDQITVYENEQESLDFLGPLAEVSLHQSDSVSPAQIQYTAGRVSTLQSSQTGSIQGEVKLFGLIHCKYIQFDVSKQERVMPVGAAVGLYISADGLMVLGNGTVTDQQGVEQSPSDGILRTGDYIKQIDGQTLETIADFANAIQKSHGRRMVLSVQRGKSQIQVRITPVLCQDGFWQIGVWLREDTEGIGTLTFVTEKNQFAALGHGITDVDTGDLIQLQNGGLYPATLGRVVAGRSGVPGELSGSVALGEENRLGTIQHNTALGITGTLSGKTWSYDVNRSVPVGHKQDVKKGKATILCQLGDQVKEYSIEIEKIKLSSTDNKGMEIHVTDRGLQKEAGGIVQGMSGAPILQNGKCVGAVTHVFVKDPTRGYGTFVENMM